MKTRTSLAPNIPNKFRGEEASERGLDQSESIEGSDVYQNPVTYEGVTASPEQIGQQTCCNKARQCLDLEMPGTGPSQGFFAARATNSFRA